MNTELAALRSPRVTSTSTTTTTRVYNDGKSVHVQRNRTRPGKSSARDSDLVEWSDEASGAKSEGLRQSNETDGVNSPSRTSHQPLHPATHSIDHHAPSQDHGNSNGLSSAHHAPYTHVHAHPANGSDENAGEEEMNGELLPLERSVYVGTDTIHGRRSAPVSRMPQMSPGEEPWIQPPYQR